MCGIAAIITGVCITGSHLCWQINGTLHSQECESDLLNIDEFKAALKRRGPDSLDCKKVLIQLESGNLVEKNDDQVEITINPICYAKMLNSRIASAVELTSIQNSGAKEMKSVAQLDFIGATLQLRGSSPVSQPLVDASGNLLLFNGEIFGGVHVADDSNDSDALLHALERCCSSDCFGFQVRTCSAELGKSIPEILSSVKGPWAFIYWQEYSKTIWFGRDAFGRRSLLVHWPTLTDPQFLLSSVSPPSLAGKYSGSSSMKDELDNEMVSEVTNPTHGFCYWEELPCGIYSIELKTSKENENCMKESLIGEVRKHKWTDPLLSKIISWDRSLLDPKIEYGMPLQIEQLLTGTCCDIVHSEPTQRVLSALRRSVMRRTTISSIFQTDMKQCGEVEMTPVAVLFSGGLDSMILAALLDQCLNPQYIIDLLNVSFDGQLAPDRVSAKLGLRELQKVAPSRRWRLVEIDGTLLNLTKETKHVMSLIHPANTYMDLNIGIALWLAAGGDGWVDGQICNLQEDQHRYQYRSRARVLLVGSGADEQCAGYGRHRTKYKHGGWLALHEEMRLDMQRIWKRNLGRDDRLISDCGKEARFPFLDEEVIQSLLEIPLWDIATLDEPVGKGDKKILREVARLLCLEDAADMPKRAIQFGTRIARESNRKNFGSNRAANQASAGSVKIHEHSH